MVTNCSLLEILHSNESQALSVINSRVSVLKTLRHDLANIAAVLEFDSADLAEENYALTEIKSLISSLDTIIDYYKNINASRLADAALVFFGDQVSKQIDYFPSTFKGLVLPETATVVTYFKNLVKVGVTLGDTMLLDLDLINIFLNPTNLVALNFSDENKIKVSIEKIKPDPS